MDAIAPKPEIPVRAKVGRKRLPKDQVRGYQFAVLMSLPMKAWLEAELERNGLTRSDYVDMLIRFHASKTKNPRPVPAR